MKELSHIPFDDIPEDLPDGPEVPEITPRQYSRLKGFEHIQEQIRRYQPIVDTGRPYHWGHVNEEGKVIATHLVIDQPQLDRMKHMAYGMYESDLSRNPATRDIAMDIVHSVKEDDVAPMGKRRFSELWERE